MSEARWIVIVGTILGLALIGAGALGSWRVYARRRRRPRAPA